jgi:hypothetical protein
VRTRSAVSLASLATVLAGISATAVAAASSPATGSAYPWVQPWGVSDRAGHLTQPPASVPAPAAAATGPDASYVWAQPWGVAARTPGAGHLTQPPAD